MHGLTGVVLTGGHSRRMGRDKAALPLGGGLRVIDAVVQALRQAGCDPLWLAGAGDYGLGLRVIPDAARDMGPLGGLAAALRAAATPRLFAAACDLPLLQPALIRLLAGRVAGWDAAVPAYGHTGWQPLCAVYSRACLPVAEERLAAGDGRLISLLERVRARRVEEDELRTADPELVSFLNVNTPEVYERARVLWGRLSRRRPRRAAAGPGDPGTPT